MSYDLKYDGEGNVAKATTVILQRGHIAHKLNEAGPGVVKQLTRMEQELRREWRAGKPVQRKQILKFLPTIWEEAYGLPLRQKPPPFPQGLVDSGYPNHDRFVQLVAEHVAAMLAQGVEARTPEAQVHTAISMAIHATLYPIWTYMRAIEMSAPNVFSVRDSLVEKLLNTDVENVRADDVRLPFPALYISMPFGEKTLLLRNQTTGLHEVSLVGVAEGNIQGERGLFCTFWGEPRPDSRDQSDDHVYSFNFSLPKGATESLSELFEVSVGRATQQMEEHGIVIQGGLRRDMGRFYGESFDFQEALALLRRFIVNFCLYLSSPGADVQPTKSGQQQWETVYGQPTRRRTSVRVSKKKRRTSKKKKAFKPTYTVWDVGRNVTKLRRTLSARDILVRGHFRRQAYGEGRKLRKVIWIEPHIRLPTGEEPAGHEYEVEPNA